jgi:hypothetical protein
VLKNEKEFHSVEHDRSMKLKEFCDLGGTQGPYEAFTFVVLDMDRDGVSEGVVFVGDNLVLHAENGVVYGYLFGIRSMQMLKKDGSYHGSNSADGGMYLRINEFHGKTYKEEILGEYDGDEYKIKGRRVASKEEFERMIAGLIDKNDAHGFDFTQENIEAQLAD